MALRERRYRSRFRREEPQESPEERFSVTNRTERNRLEIQSMLLKWAPIALVAAVAWWLVDTYVLH